MLATIITSAYKGATLTRGKHYTLPTREMTEGQNPCTLRLWV